ncbi:MAG: ClbS/DfsB family four-helix bundle protein [Bacteroidota bacterium]
MPRPQTKTEIISQSEGQFDQLLFLVASMVPELRQSDFSPGTMNRNVRDVFAHLHHWHLLLLGWYKVGMSGEKPHMPAKGYTWKNTSELNLWIWEQYQSHSLNQIFAKLRSSHEEVICLINAHSEEELFEKKRYAWTGSTSLGAYLISATSSHYHWAYKLIKKGTHQLC